MVPHYNLAFTISDSQSYKICIERSNIFILFSDFQSSHPIPSKEGQGPTFKSNTSAKFTYFSAFWPTLFFGNFREY